MIRWSYVFPRLLILALISLLVVFAMDPVLRWTLIFGGQRATGAKVDIASLQSSIRHAAIRIDHVEMADPSDTDRNLVEADQVFLQLDSDEFLRRNWVIDHGHVVGIRFDASRATSGALEVDDTDADEGAGLGGLFSGAGQKLLDHVAAEAEEEFESLESVQLSRELMHRWPLEYQSLDRRADALNEDIRQLRDLIDVAEDHPLRALESSQQALQQLARLKRAPAELRAEFARLAGQAKQDRHALDEARKRDTERIREKIDVGNLDSEQLTKYLFNEEWSQRIGTLIGWIDRIRSLSGQAPEASRGRGVDILFPGLTPRPDFLIRSLLVEGEANLGRQSVPFAGIVTGVTSDPEIYGKPAVVRLQSDAAGGLRIHAIVDQTGASRHSRIVIDCPQLPQPATTLGRTDELTVGVAPGDAHLWAQIDLTEVENLAGRILYVRDQVTLEPQASPKLKDQVLTDAWHTAFRDIENLHAAIDLTGTVTKPKWKLRSNLGPQLTSGLNAAMREELAGRQEQLAHKLQQSSDAQIARFNEMISSKQQELLKKLNLGEQELSQLQDLISAHTKLPGINLGDKLPLGKLFKR